MTTTPTVQEAWASVMVDVRALGKTDRNSQQGFSFRGVDAVMNAVGPALRDHGVAVVPSRITDVTCATYTTKSGTVMRDVALVASYTIIGPAGDTIAGMAAGEASDAGDKAVPKAMSVAYRTFLLQALCLPTDEPDPDLYSYERAGAAQETASQAVARGIASASTLAELDSVLKWGAHQGVTPPVGQVQVRRRELAAGSLLSQGETA